MVQQLHNKIKIKYFLFIFVLFSLTACPFIPGTSPVPPINTYMVFGKNINCKFKLSFNNVEGCVYDSLGQNYNPNITDIFLFSPYNGDVTYSCDYHKSLLDQNNTGIKFYGFKKGDKLRAIILESSKNIYDIIGNEYFCRLGPHGKNDFTEEEFATLLQRVDDYIDTHGDKWAKRAGENDTVLILGNY